MSERNGDWKYHLATWDEMHRRKARCPECGRRSFVLYVDQAGEPLDERVGRCDREDSCGYHLKPSEFFRDNPSYSRYERYHRDFRRQPVRQEKRAVTLPPDSVLSYASIVHPQNNLARWMAGRYGEELTRRAMVEYCAQASPHWAFKGGYATAFPQFDHLNRLHQVKVIMYDPDTGHRLKSCEGVTRLDERTGQWYPCKQDGMVWFAGRKMLADKGIHDCELTQCLFGGHLLRRYPKARVCVCESEKTALVASVFFADAEDQCVWLATGGKVGAKLNSELSKRMLRGRDVTLYPDLRCEELWAEQARELEPFVGGVAISHALAERADKEAVERGLDVADFIDTALERLDIL